MSGFRLSESKTKTLPVVCGFSAVFFLAAGIIANYNTAVFQYDRLGTTVYYIVSITCVIFLLWFMIAVCSNGGVSGRDRFYLAIILCGMCAYGAYLLEAPDYALSLVPGFWTRQIDRENVFVPSLSTTKFRGRFRHYVDFGDRKGMFSEASFPILETTYDAVVDNAPNPPSYYHVGTDALSGICFQATVATAVHLRRIDVGAWHAPAASFKKC